MTTPDIRAALAQPEGPGLTVDLPANYIDLEHQGETLAMLFMIALAAPSLSRGDSK
jgi:hypothetical protein